MCHPSSKTMFDMKQIALFHSFTYLHSFYTHMKIALKILFLFQFAALFAEQRVSSTTKEATVYLNGAKLTNTATIRVEAGRSEVVFENLSAYIYAPSVQVKLGGDVKLLSAKFRTKYIEGTREDAKIKALQDSLEVLSQIERGYNDEIYSYQQEEKMLTDVYNKLLNSSNDWVKAITPFSISDMKNFPDEYRSKLSQIRQKLRELDLKRRKTQEENMKIQQRIANLAPKNAKNTGEISLQLSSATSQTIEISCIYLMTAANWTPLYDISSEGTDKPVKLTYKGNVRQWSDLDWKNVKLKLSTANPFSNNSRPILNPLYVDYYVVNYYRDVAVSAAPAAANTYTLSQQENIIVAGGAPIKALEKKKEDLDDNDERTRLDAKEVLENLQQQVFVELDVPLLHDIPSSQEEHIIEVENYVINAQYQYHAVPKMESSVFLLAKITQYGQYNLMPGNANIFYQNTLIGQSFIDPKTVSDTMLLSFGKDENISIKRVRAIDLTASKIIGTNKKETLGFDITVKNNRPVAINIEILDQIPVSRKSEVEVTPEDLSGAEYTKDYGKLLWRVNVPAGQSKKIRFTYSIKYPKDKAITFQN